MVRHACFSHQSICFIVLQLIVILPPACLCAQQDSHPAESKGSKSNTKQRLVVLTFDDASASHYSVVRPLLLKYRFGATFFITEGWDFNSNKKDYLTWEQIKKLDEDGFEIGNHTKDHLGITERTVSRLDEQLRGIESRCEEYGIQKPISFAWPGNAITSEAFPILRDHGIIFARRGGGPEYPYASGKGFAYEPGRDHPYLIPSAGDARPNWNLDDFTTAVDKAEPGKVAVLQFHGVPDTAHDWVSSSVDRFESYLRYLALNDFKVIALRDLRASINEKQWPAEPFQIADPFQIIEQRKKLIQTAEE